MVPCGSALRSLLKLLRLTRMLTHSMNLYGFKKLLGNEGRCYAWQLLGASIAENARIGPRVRIRNPSNITIGTGTAIIGRAWIDSWGPVHIGRNVLLNDDVSLLTASHVVNSVDLVEDVRPITIGNYAWLPQRIIVLPGVSIGESAVVGTGSVVTRDVPEYTVVAGNPALVVSKRERQAFRYVPSNL